MVAVTSMLETTSNNNLNSIASENQTNQNTPSSTSDNASSSSIAGDIKILSIFANLTKSKKLNLSKSKKA